MERNELRQDLMWAARVLGVLDAAFFATFALAEIPDVASAAIMLITPALIIMTLVIAWRMPLYGGAAFLILGGILVAFYDGLSSWPQFLIVCLPTILTGALFVASNEDKGRKRRR